MAYENFIGLRYLMAKQRGCAVSAITLLSIIGVTLGVTAMIVVLSVMGGFKQDLKEKILGTKAHMVVRSADGSPMENPEEVLEVAEGFDGIIGAAGFLEAEVMASSPTNLNGVMLRGVDPERIGEVSDLDQALVHEKARGRLSNLDHPGREREKLQKESRRDERSIREKLESAEPGFEGDLVPDSGLLPPPEREAPEPPSAGDETGEIPGQGPPDAGATESRADEADASGTVEGADAGGSMPPTAPSQARGAGSREGDSPMPPIAPANAESKPAAVESPTEVESPGKGGGMPPIAGEAEGDDSGDSGMPPVAGDDEEDEEETQLPGILIGKELAKSLKVGLGDEVNVVTPQGEMGPTGPIPRSRPFRVVGVFYTGMYEYDANYAYARLDDVKDFLDQKGVTGVELKAKSVDGAIPLANELQKALPEGYEVRDWKEMNRSLFYALKLEKISMFVVLTFIILVASFSIIAMLIMIVLEKKRDISVLKSMGVTDGGIMRIFMYQGVVIGGVGAAVGLVLGLTICFFLIEFGFPLNSKVYYISTLPVDVDAVEVALVVGATVFISFVATIYPSWKAAQLTPVEGLRYE